MVVPVRKADIQGGPVQIDGQTSLLLGGDYMPRGPASFSGSCQRLGDGLYLVSGNLKFCCSAPCARCLKPTEVSFTVPFEERFERESTKSDEEIYPYTGDEIDLDPALNEAAITALPMRVLCKEDCKGLCPECGADRNESECGCQRASGSAFSALKQWTEEV